MKKIYLVKRPQYKKDKLIVKYKLEDYTTI